jgi:hypothetical protein
MDSSFGLTGKDFVIICTDNSVAHSILKLKVLIKSKKLFSMVCNIIFSNLISKIRIMKKKYIQSIITNYLLFLDRLLIEFNFLLMLPKIFSSINSRILRNLIQNRPPLTFSNSNFLFMK